MLLGFCTGPRTWAAWLQAKPICVAVCPGPSGSFPNHEASPSHFSSSALGVLVCEGVAVTSSSWSSCEDKYHFPPHLGVLEDGQLLSWSDFAVLFCTQARTSRDQCSSVFSFCEVHETFFFFNRENPLTSFLADNKKEELRLSAGKTWCILKV